MILNYTKNRKCYRSMPLNTNGTKIYLTLNSTPRELCQGPGGLRRMIPTNCLVLSLEDIFSCVWILRQIGC